MTSNRVGMATLGLVGLASFLLGAIAASGYDLIRFPVLSALAPLNPPSHAKPKPKAPDPLQPILKGDALRDALRKGGYVLFVRHATRNETKTVTPFDAALLGNKPLLHPELKTGLCLNPEGEAEAWLIGQAVRELAIPVGRVLASPTCRAKQTASIALGRIDEVNPYLSYWTTYREDERKRAGDELLRLLGTPPAAGTNTFLFSHGTLLEHVGLPVILEQAEAAVFEPQAGAKPRFVARVSPLTWVHLLERDPALKK